MNNSQIVSDLKNRNNAAYDLLYTFYYPTIERFVKRNSGTSNDAKDVFQETIIVLLNKTYYSTGCLKLVKYTGTHSLDG